MSSIFHPTERFSDRVDAYIRFRPGYPAAVLGLLTVECGLTPHHLVADVRRIFDAHQVGGQVVFHYTTEVTYVQV